MKTNSALKFYHYLKDSAADYCGYSRLEMHSIAKKHLFPLLIDDDENFNLEEFSTEEINNCKELSLKMLSEKGLDRFVEGFKVFCLDNFNFSV